MSTTYKVYFAPRISLDFYGPEVDVSDFVSARGAGEITRSIDSGDYDIGVYTYGDVTLSCENSTGKFNEPSDPRSMFSFVRDLTKVRVVFSNAAGDTITFRGLINDEASRNDVRTDEIEFRVLSYDSVIRKSQVQAGSIPDGQTFQAAIFTILNSFDITPVLGVSLSNILVGFNGIVNNGAAFNGVEKREALNQLLLASNSCMIINSSSDVIVRPRNQDTVKPILQLYGRGDLLARENILSLSEYNTGLQRMFNSIKINDTQVQDAASISQYKARQKSFDLDWMNDLVNTADIANAVLSEFKFPKVEFEVEVLTSVASGYDLLDRVSVSYPLLARPYGRFIPMYGVTKYGEVEEPYPYITGAISIDASVGFKIIEIRENTAKFTTRLKLRQIGTGPSDGNF